MPSTMTVEELLDAMRALVEGAGDDPMTEEAQASYEEYERQLATANKDRQIRSRQAAYDTPTRPDVHVHTAVRREDDTLERAYDAYLRTGVANQDLTELRAQGEGTAAAGGYMVPPGFRQKMVEVMAAFGGLASAVDSFSTTTGQTIEYPSIDDTGNSGTITAEGATFSGGADLTFGTVNLGAYKYTSSGASNLPLKVSVELLQDAGFDVRALVSRALGTRIARKQAAHWCTGTGVGEPTGLVSSSLTKDRDLDTADTPDYQDLVEFADLLDEAYEANASWVMRKNTWAQLRLVVDSNGRPIIQDSTVGISGLPERSLLGRPVIIDPGMPLLSSAGITTPIAYGDFREAYVIRRVSNLSVVVDPYSYAAAGQVAFTAWERADGQVQNRSAYVILRNNT